MAANTKLDSIKDRINELEEKLKQREQQSQQVWHIPIENKFLTNVHWKSLTQDYEEDRLDEIKLLKQKLKNCKAE